jgi:hypothetical protein
MAWNYYSWMNLETTVSLKGVPSFISWLEFPSKLGTGKSISGEYWIFGGKSLRSMA